MDESSEEEHRRLDHRLDYRLGGWRVQPSLNRLRRGETSVRIEPKLMDVLLHLARHAGEPVSKDELAAAVWPGVFVTDSVITRAIAGLRKAFEDDARAPRFIETIAKRGYRLLVTPERPATDVDVAREPARALPGRDPRDLAAGYVVGQWVRGHRFYGRSAEIAEILDGPRNGLWLLGSRAIGKTSLLKQLELLTSEDPRGPYFPLFWDLQGSAEPEDLHDDFAAALADAEERLDALGIALADVTADDFLVSLGKLRKAVRSRGRTLLLLWDEVEELVHLHSLWPSLLRKLRRALQSQEGVRTVIASGPRLWQLAEQRDDTSPFLHGFAPPLYVGPLRDHAASDLVRQAQARGGERIDEPETATEIARRCGNHPHLLQMLATRTLELGDLEQATEAVVADRTARFFFAVDFDLLTPAERDILLSLARSSTAAAPVAIEPEELGLEQRPLELGSRLLHLEGLGMVRREGSRVAIAHPILHRWLAG